MRSGLSALRPLLFAIVGSVALPALTMAQDAPETPWGAPDLQGVWDFRTITPLQRPEDLGDKAFLPEEEAAQARAPGGPLNAAAPPDRPPRSGTPPRPVGRPPW